jgi:glutathione S-transferase
MSKIVLYHSPYSPFSRSVLLLSRHLNLDVDVKVLDLMDDEQMSPEFLKINPQHCVPTIDDNGFYLWESRAVLGYLAETKAPHLLPTSPKEKAIVNQRLYFELGGLANKYAAIYVSCSFAKSFHDGSHVYLP